MATNSNGQKDFYLWKYVAPCRSLHIHNLSVTRMIPGNIAVTTKNAGALRVKDHTKKKQSKDWSSTAGSVLHTRAISSGHESFILNL